MISEEARFNIKKDIIRKRLIKYTRKAFRVLPKLDKPRILDIGCGAGVPTLELARLTNGEITCLDIDEEQLGRLLKKCEKLILSDRIKVMKCSIIDMPFPEESFDLIWAEGSVSVVGFESGLRNWKRFLKAGGFMVIHDEKGDIEGKLKQISSYGYELLAHFILDEDIWWAEYFTPLEKLIIETQAKCADNAEILDAINNARREIDMFLKSPELYGSVFFIMKKR